MSLLIAHVQPDQLLVAVDTEGIDPSGRRFQASKLKVLPHARVVLAARGLQSYLSLLELHLCEPRVVPGYDELLGELGSKLTSVRGELCRMAAARGLDLAICDQLELLVGGWSASAGCFGGQMVYIEPLSGRLTFANFDEATPWCFAPCRENDLSFPPLVARPGGIEAIARAQCAYLAEFPNQASIAYGGKLIQCVMRERETTITEVCDLR